MNLAIKRLIFAAATAAAVAGTSCAPSQAADLGLGRPHAKPIRTTWQGWNWRDRCAFEGYYCLYAEYGFVYAYPWDDRPVAAAFYARRRYRR
jgi:hypothetical protein